MHKHLRRGKEAIELYRRLFALVILFLIFVIVVVTFTKLRSRSFVVRAEKFLTSTDTCAHLSLPPPRHPAPHPPRTLT